MSQNKSSPSKVIQVKKMEDKINIDYDKLCKIIQDSSLTLKQIKNGQSLFQK